MVKEEIWSVTIERATGFFRSQSDLVEQDGLFHFNSAWVKLTALKPAGTGFRAARRVRLHIEGEEKDVEEIYHRFFIQFLSTGG